MKLDNTNSSPRRLNPFEKSYKEKNGKVQAEYEVRKAKAKSRALSQCK